MLNMTWARKYMKPTIDTIPRRGFRFRVGRGKPLEMGPTSVNIRCMLDQRERILVWTIATHSAHDGMCCEAGLSDFQVQAQFPSIQ